MPLDVQLTIYQRSWQIIRTYAPYIALGVLPIGDPRKMRPANEFDTTATAAGLKSNSNERAADQGGGPARFPRLKLDAFSENDGQGAPVTFCDGVDYGVPVQVTLGIKLIWDNGPTLDQQTSIESVIRAAFIAAGRKLAIPWTTTPTVGIPWVSTARLSNETKRSMEKSVDTDNTLRPTSRMQLIVNGRPMRSQFAV